MWQPEACLNTLKSRAAILARIRLFFELQKITEIDVPVISESSVTDPYLDAVTASDGLRSFYLQTSPEYYMKRILAAHKQCVYYLGKAFRAEENSRIHSLEFTMLEWYRVGFNDEQLMCEIEKLLVFINPKLKTQRISYGNVFEQTLGVNPHTSSAATLSAIAKTHLDVQFKDDDINTWLDLLFSHIVEPSLPQGLITVYDYPASLCALAKVVEHIDGYKVAKRFECFLNGVELANGYWELTDANEQRRRFESDNAKRKALNKMEITPDSKLLAALDFGLPECAGVALGVDRLIKSLLSLESIREQQAFQV